MKCARVLIVVVIVVVVANRARATRENDYDDDDGDVAFASWSLTRAMAMGEWRRGPGRRFRARVVAGAGRRRWTEKYGNAHEMDCGSNGVMTRFRSSLTRRAGRCTRVACGGGGEAASEADGSAAAREGDAARTEWVAIVGRNAMWDLDQHVVDCGNQFVRRWVLRQWSNSMQI